MSRGKWIFIVITLLFVTNLINYGLSFYHYQEKENLFQEKINDSNAKLGSYEITKKRLQKELERLKVWKTFIQIQQELYNIKQAIHNLNFGIAISQLEAMKQQLKDGKFGPQFNEHKDELIEILDECMAGLKRKNEKIESQLTVFNEKSFEILSGISPMETVSGQTEAPVPPASLKQKTDDTGSLPKDKGENP